MAASAQLALETLRALGADPSTEAIFDRYLAFAGRFGISNCIFAHLGNRADFSDVKTFYFANWPAEYLRARQAVDADRFDPVVRFGLQTHRRFLWSEAFATALPREQKALRVAADFRFNQGIMFPLRSFGFPLGGASIGGERLEASHEDLFFLELVTRHAYALAESHCAPPLPELEAELSVQEIDVLQYAADGKDAWASGVLMNISTDAVNDALKRARRKLSAANKTHAVARALALGLIA